jgi:hypothetical protein
MQTLPWFVVISTAVSASGMVMVGILMAVSPDTYVGLRNGVSGLWQKQPSIPRSSFNLRCRGVGILMALLGLWFLKTFALSV